MQHHVYAVWDFMSLIKALQQHLAPVRLPWIPPVNSRYANFINQLVIEEESDTALSANTRKSHASHFESYCEAMAEVDADTRTVLRFIQSAHTDGIDHAMQSHEVPPSARRFMQFTFDVISRNQPHLIAALLAYSRESLVPLLFRAMLQRLPVKPTNTPALHAYLLRHIELDEHEHGPLAREMTQALCQGSPQKKVEVRDIAEQALQVRLEFWDAIHQSITSPIPDRSMDHPMQRKRLNPQLNDDAPGPWTI